jgi:D-serine deaminase-like pyridoxal phosphate-dependent protein
MTIDELPTPALVVDRDALDHNIAVMGDAWPGRSLRAHVKAWKCTELARRIAAAGHPTFCCATAREVEGMAAAGLGDDLLLANEVLGRTAERLGAVACDGAARVTVAVDSDATVDAAAKAGIREVLVDVMVGMPRCGCDPADAGRIAERARAAGLEVRGVMGYEGHLMTEPEATKAGKVEAAMARLLAAHDLVGGDVVSGGGTGTWATNRWVNELQAGSFALMDTDYGAQGHPFLQALHVVATVIAVNGKGWAVADAGLKAIAMDHGNPTVEGGDVWFVSDEHTTFGPADGHALPAVGATVRVVPAHIDPTIAKHERLYVVAGADVVDEWAIDLRHW